MAGAQAEAQLRQWKLEGMGDPPVHRHLDFTLLR